MPIADLYIRVSTDDQRDKGFSQRSREEVLRQYCDRNFIQIRYVTFEDRNPVHYGKIHIPKYRDEDSIFVQGKHKDYNIEGILEKGMRNLSQLDILYETGGIDTQRKIISSIIPKNQHLLVTHI